MPLFASSSSSRGGGWWSKKKRPVEKEPTVSTMASKQKKTRRNKNKKQQRGVKFQDDGSFPKLLFSGAASTPCTRQSKHDMFSGFSGTASTPISRVSTTSTVTESIWSTQSAPEKKKSKWSLFRMKSKKGIRSFSKLEEHDGDVVVKLQQSAPIKTKKHHTKPTTKLTTVSEKTEERLRHYAGPVDLDDTIHSVAKQKSTTCTGPVDLDDSVTSDDISDTTIESIKKKERQSDALFMQKQNRHIAELDAIVQNFEDGHYCDDTTTEEEGVNVEDIPHDYAMADMLSGSNGSVGNEDAVDEEEEDDDDEQLAAAVAAVAAEIAGVDLNNNNIIVDEPTKIEVTHLPPRTPRNTDNTILPSPSPPKTPQGDAPTTTQRFRLSPSFKEIIVCTTKNSKRSIPRHRSSFDAVTTPNNNVDASPYSQTSDSYLSEVSSLSGGGAFNVDDTTPKFQHTGWLSSNGIAPKTSYPSASGQQQEEECNIEQSSYQPFEFVLTTTDSGSDDHGDDELNTSSDIINADTQLSTQMMVMGQEILRKLTGNAAAVVHNGNDIAKLPKGESPASKTTTHTGAAKCLMLLMDPRRRIFEVIPVFSTTNVTTVADLLSQIPYQATDYRLKFQEYVGLCYSDDLTGDSHHLATSDKVSTALLEHKLPTKPLFAIPQHYTPDQIELFGGTLLKNNKVIRMIHDHQVLLGMKTTTTTQ